MEHLKSTRLFEPIQLGRITTSHRLVLAPLTRNKSTKKVHVPIVSLMKTYYSQRASFPASFLITEATFIAPQAGGFDNIPGIWNEDQIQAWAEVVNGVHEQGSFIFLQLWALGRAAKPKNLSSESLPYVAPSPIGLKFHKGEIPRELSKDEIREYVDFYAQAAKNALNAGFDGVEIHGANGYLIDQFLQDVSNQRTDEYGGSIENRCRFAFEVADAVTEAIGEERTGFRISPWSRFQEMRMNDPIQQYSYFVQNLKERYPRLAYLHVVEPGASGSATEDPNHATDSNDFIREIWTPRPLISAGGYTRDAALERAEAGNELVAFGKYYISNPDLPLRLKKDIELTPFDSKTFYTPGDTDGAAHGYIDYPFADDAQASQSSQL